MSTPILELPEWAPQLCADWHGGQSSAMYAVASTGALSRGTIRPSWLEYHGERVAMGPVYHHVPTVVRATDEQWDYELVERLRDECAAAAEHLRNDTRGWLGPDALDMVRLIDLRDVCDRWLEDHADVLEEDTP